MQGRPDPDAELRAALARHRAFATALLLLMAAILVGSYWLEPGYWRDLVQAAAKAGVVGGIADWFAVTALFRYPLGLRIPHTAIIPRQKERLGRGLGRFVAGQVFTEEELHRLMRRIDVARILERFLSDPAQVRPAAIGLAGLLPRVLTTLEDGRARRVATRLLPRLVTGPAAARMLARVLRAMLAGGQHQAVFTAAVAELKRILVDRQADLEAAIAARVRAEGGALVGWMAGAYIARRILAAANAELEKVEPEDSSLRAAFEAWLEAEIQRLETDPGRAEAVARAVRRALSHPSVAAWLADAWERIKQGIAADAAREDGRTVALLAGFAANAGALLAEDAAARERVNQGAERIVATLLPAAQARLAEFIGDVVSGWDTRTITEKLELRVGRDLQYVRINGTIVGALVGAALFVLLTELFGRVAT
ncbi:MAG: DUF445 domain-containing protein [Acetobacteraceae bacterium]|nr:DUF445 domain-containing protein [Acetobacteraceae bacterium]